MRRTETTRRTFLRAMAGAGAAVAAGGCTSWAASRPQAVAKGFIWAYMPQFGMNMWGDIVTLPKRDGQIVSNLTDAEFALIADSAYHSREAIRFDEALWRRLSAKLRTDGCNLLLIDVGEFVVYPSHPELAVKGSWTAQRLRDEVDRLTALGFEVVPKINFSACHDFWLKDYARMLSTAKYYEVAADLIADVCEIFNNPRFVHLGLDEEDKVDYQKRTTSLVRFRQGDLWWHDVLFLVREVERHGARAWMWSDYVRYHEVSEFAKKMPRTVVQSPWTYHAVKPDFSDPLIRVFRTLTDNGYDVIPCGSNCYGKKENFPAMAAFCRANLPAERLLGMLFAPWMQTREPYGRLLLEGSSLMAEARARQS